LNAVFKVFANKYKVICI